MLEFSLPRRAQRKACELQKEGGSMQARRRSPGHRSSGILILDFPDSSLCEIIFCYFKSLSLWYFDMTT